MPRHTPTARVLPRLGAAAVIAAALTLTGCGFDAQTLQPYTPAHGVNVDNTQVYVRNLLIIANGQGKGRLSASITSRSQKDALTAVSGVAQKTNGTDGSPLTFSSSAVELPAGKLVVLTGEGAPDLTVSGPDLKPGLTAKLNLQFASGLQQQVVVPVVDAASPMYASAAPELKG